MIFSNDDKSSSSSSSSSKRKRRRNSRNDNNGTTEQSQEHQDAIETEMPQRRERRRRRTVAAAAAAPAGTSRTRRREVVLPTLAIMTTVMLIHGLPTCHSFVPAFQLQYRKEPLPLTRTGNGGERRTRRIPPSTIATTTTTTTQLQVSTTTPLLPTNEEQEKQEESFPRTSSRTTTTLLQHQQQHQQQLERKQPWWIWYFHVWNAVLQWQDDRYAASLAIKCPFLRRRSADFFDAVDGTLQHLYRETVLSHLQQQQQQQQQQQPRELSRGTPTSLVVAWTPIAWRQDDEEEDRRARTTTTTTTTKTRVKLHHLTIEQVAQALCADWKPATTSTAATGGWSLSSLSDEQGNSTSTDCRAVASFWPCSSSAAPQEQPSISVSTTHNNHNRIGVDKGYYVTGRLNASLYANDCRFEGPDPDLPITGLRKYANAAAGLFDPKTSRATLHRMEIVVPDGGDETRRRTRRKSHNDENDDDIDMAPYIQAHWTFRGTLRLPWHPKLPVVHGSTRYYMDNNNNNGDDHDDDDDGSVASSSLITRHVESWHNLNAWQAFWETFVVPPHDEEVANSLQQ